MATAQKTKTRSWLRRTPSLDRFISEHAQPLQELQRPVVLIAGYRTRETLATWRNAFQFRLHVITPHDVIPVIDGIASFAATSTEAMEEYIASIGPVAAVIDEEAEDLPIRLERFQRFFWHVSSGGFYITPITTISSAWDAGRQALSAKKLSDDEVAELDRSAGLTLDDDGYSVTVKNRDHLAKVRDEDAMTVLPGRLGANNVRLMGSRGSGKGPKSLHFESHGARRRMRLPAPQMKYPELTLKDFHGPTQLRDAMLAVNGSTVLPSSFKHPWRAWNDNLVNYNDRVATLTTDDHRADYLAGEYYDLTCAVPGHFGHVMTESLAKLWGWREAKRQIPGLKAFYRMPSADHEPTFEKALFTAAGIDERDLHWEHRDVTVDRFVSASQAWQNGGWHFVHPVIVDTWKELRKNLVEDDETSPRKIFVSRQRGAENRAVRNLAEVEQYFEDRGFAVIYPEELSTRGQATVFGNARVIAGLAGSGMFNMLFAEHLEKVILLSHDSYTARNEHIYASLLADEFHYFWSPADQEQGKSGFDLEAFHSSWEFDFETNRAALDQVTG